MYLDIACYFTFFKLKLKTIHSHGLTLCLQKVFCSGGNLDFIRKFSKPESGYKFNALMHDSVIRLQSLPLVSVCHVDGRAIGGGAELALWTDFRDNARRQSQKLQNNN
jgi:enoyl-CoA hydratase/carnithine racemase